jgi:hypothetical protein
LKAKIRWTLEFDYPLSKVECFDSLKFYLEENHCQENILEYLLTESEPNVCKLCHMGKVEVLEQE